MFASGYGHGHLGNLNADAQAPVAELLSQSLCPFQAPQGSPTLWKAKSIAGGSCPWLHIGITHKALKHTSHLGPPPRNSDFIDWV